MTRRGAGYGSEAVEAINRFAREFVVDALLDEPAPFADQDAEEEGDDDDEEAEAVVELQEEEGGGAAAGAAPAFRGRASVSWLEQLHARVSARMVPRCRSVALPPCRAHNRELARRPGRACARPRPHACRDGAAAAAAGS